jgi:hypothetical protein
MISTIAIIITFILLNLGYLVLLIIKTLEININIKAIEIAKFELILKIPVNINVEINMAVAGIGKPIKPLRSKWSEITLYLVNLKTPVITINKDIIVEIGINSGVFNAQTEYKSIPGATPKDTRSDKESIFLPNPYSSVLPTLLATQPSTESKMIAKIIAIAESLIW